MRPRWLSVGLLCSDIRWHLASSWGMTCSTLPGAVAARCCGSKGGSSHWRSVKCRDSMVDSMLRSSPQAWAPPASVIMTTVDPACSWEQTRNHLLIHSAELDQLSSNNNCSILSLFSMIKSHLISVFYVFSALRVTSMWQCWTSVPLQRAWMLPSVQLSGWESLRGTRCLLSVMALRDSTKDR